VRRIVPLLVLAAALAAGEPGFEKRILDRAFFSEGADTADIDHDGHGDVVAGPFWYAGPDFTRRHRYEAGEALDPHGYSERFFLFTDDVDRDGWCDIVVVGFPGAAARWCRNPGTAGGAADAGWAAYPVLESVDDESPQLIDVDSDGRRDLVCAQGGRLGYAGVDPADATRPWTFHPCSATDGRFQRFTHGLGLGDVDGDGRQDLLEARGWWRQPAALAGDPTWEFHAADLGEGGAQMYAVDIDGDGRADVCTTLQAHGYGLAWFQQQPDGSFAKHVIMGDPASGSDPCFSQPHALAVADVDGDGLPDLGCGKRRWAHGPDGDPEPNAPALLYWWRLVRGPDGARFEAHRIDADSGVGTQIEAKDVDGDGRVDVIVGNKNGAFVFLQR
jgi:hypothetical protein